MAINTDGLSAAACANTCGFSTMGVPRRMKVAETAACNSVPRKSEAVANSQTSKKSFILLLRRPSEIIASNFSATAVSRL
jgi:hypothetical protein